MSESDKVDHHVRTWYADKTRFAPQGKTSEWPDRVLLDQGEFLRGRHVLNLGCFYPEDELAFSHLAQSWIAIDFVPEVIEGAKSVWPPEWDAQVRFIVADMRKLPFTADTFDVVTDFSSGDHLLREDWHKTIKEVHRVLGKGGHFLVCFANRQAFIDILKVSELGVPWAEHPEQFCEYGYVRTDTPAMMRNALELHGFEIVRTSHCVDTQLRAGMLAVKL